MGKMGSSRYGVIVKAGVGADRVGTGGRARHPGREPMIQADRKTFRKRDLLIQGIIPLLVLAFALCYTPINISSG